MRPAYEVAQVLRKHRHRIADLAANSWQARSLYALSVCRTRALGGHIDRCDNPDCRHTHISYNSCRNRHCPKCQGHKQHEWIQARQQELLKVPYYHVVFTLPAELNTLALYRPRTLYNLLFKISWSVLRDFGHNPKLLGARTGMIAVLHTWGQNLSLHPHLHCIVPGGGITVSGKWKNARGKGKYLFPVKAMAKVFRARFAEALRKTVQLEATTYKALFAKKWVVYCKRPFFGPEQVIEYLGRYTHKVAISNHRICDISNGKVCFSAKDYRHGGKKYQVTLNEQEFIRRFAQHILPKGFTRIRHYGILSSALKKQLLDAAGVPQPVELPEPQVTLKGRCPICKKGRMVTLELFDNRGPPQPLTTHLTPSI